MDEATYNPMDLSGRRILVTGASSGIGRATAIMLSRLRAEVICCGRDEARLAETASLMTGDRHRMEAFDLDNIDQIDEWVKKLARSTGPLFGLVHAAGVQSSLPITRVTPKHVRTLLTTNVESALALARAFGSSEVCPGPDGSLVLVSSVLASVGTRGRSAYAATKGAMEGLTPSLALELAARKVRVNCVAPSFVRTPMLGEMERFWSEEQRADVERLHPLGIGEPEDVAHAIAFLLGPCGRWITGTVLVVDGGYLAQ